MECAHVDGTGNIDTIVSEEISVDNLNLNGNAITSTNTNGDITITPNGTGSVVIDGLSHPQADGSAGQFLKTDGSGHWHSQQVELIYLMILLRN